MVYSERVKFKVGKNSKDDFEKIELEGLVLSSNVSNGIIFFSPGLCSHFDDYNNLLYPLAEEFDVVTFNHRGHGASEGRFCSLRIADDLDYLVSDGAFVLSHSAGSIGALDVKSDVKAVFVINPYLFPEILSKKQRFLLYLAKGLTCAFVQKPVQALLSVKNFNEKLGFHNKRFIDDYAALLDVPDFFSFERKVGFFVSDNDKVIGTLNNEKHYNKVKERLLLMYEDAEDYSHLVKGLNHCLNKKEGDSVPFLKTEPGKNSDKIIETIVNFYKSVL